jgi:hypothetical protein
VPVATGITADAVVESRIEAFNALVAERSEMAVNGH